MSDYTNPRAAILARCSSEANVCSQIIDLKQYAAGRYIVCEDDVYGDNIGSASSIAERHELSKLMRNIEEGSKQYDVVLVQDASRLGRSAEQVQEIANWFTERNISLHFQNA